MSGATINQDAPNGFVRLNYQGRPFFVRVNSISVVSACGDVVNQKTYVWVRGDKDAFSCIETIDEVLGKIRESQEGCEV
jgi:hypothetical protein